MLNDPAELDKIARNKERLGRVPLRGEQIRRLTAPMREAAGAQGTAPTNAADVDSESEAPELVESEAAEAPKAETKDDDNLFGEAEPEAALPGFLQEGESDDDERMGHYAPTDPSESLCPSTDSEEETSDKSPPKRGTTEAGSFSKRARMSARALRVS